MKLFVRYKKLIISLLLVIGVAGFTAAALAAPATTTAPASTTKWFRLVPECATQKGEPGKPPPVPSLVCVLQTFGNVAMIILGLTGSLALLMFVYGGFLMVVSGGSSEKVTQGKKAIMNAVIGIFIIMCSGLIIQYGMDKLQLSESYKAIGVHCKSDDKPDPKGTGTFVQIPDGTLICVSPGQCSGGSLAKYNLACEDVEGTGKGKYCIPNLCGDKDHPGDAARGMMCCYTPPATP
jgi:hypothetical protein